MTRAQRRTADFRHVSTTGEQSQKPAMVSGFQVPKKHKAMTRFVAEALGVSRMAGVYNYVEDPHDTAIVYVKCKPDTWSTIMHRAAQHTGVKHTGNAGKVARGEHA